MNTLTAFRAVKVKLKLTPDQRQYFERNAGAARFVYNNALAYQNELFEQYLDWKELNPTLSRKEYPGKIKASYYDLCKLLTDAKYLPEFSWLYNCDNSCLQQSLRNLETAYTNYFNSMSGVRKGALIGKPRFKSKRTSKVAFKIMNPNKANWINNNCIKIPKLGYVKVWSGIKQLARVKGVINSISFSRDSDNCWYASILSDSNIAISKHSSTGVTAGLDLGLKTYATFNSGHTVTIPERMLRLQKRLVRLNKAYSRKLHAAKTRGIYGSNLEKAKLKLSKCYYKIKMIRKNFHHQLSNQIVKYVDVLTIETLNIKGMVKNRRLSKAISFQGWYQFTTFLKYKFAQESKVLIEVNNFFPSSKICANCGDKNTTLALHHREWDCINCGTHHDRDVNAANNLNNISEWFKLTGEAITNTGKYLTFVIPGLKTQ